MAYIYLVEATTTSLEIACAGLDSSYNNEEREVYYSIGNLSRSNTIPNKSSHGGEVLFTGLSPATSYDITAVIVWYDAGSVIPAFVSLEDSENTLSDAVTFGWSYSKYAGSYRITAYEWNALLDFVKDKNGSISSSYVSAGDSVSAAMFNALINDIGTESWYTAHWGTRSSYYKVAGGLIYASDLNALVTLANSI